MPVNRVEKAPWLTYLEWDVLGKETEGGYRVYQVVVRIKHEGIQAVIKARRGSEFFVSFVGGGSLQSVAGKVRARVVGEGHKWREDQYASP